ncbi:hypothetical protein A6U86_33810 [Rhizobium sp. AC27/96]|nr:hypothetical protein A6U86_33810 [Rhizobium sp. AC27/96]
MGICIANAHAENSISVDHSHDFVVRGDNNSALSRQKSHYTASIPKTAKSELADHVWMAK